MLQTEEKKKIKNQLFLFLQQYSHYNKLFIINIIISKSSFQMIVVERFLNSLENGLQTQIIARKHGLKKKTTFWTLIFHISFSLERNSPVHADLQQQVNAC